MKTKFGPEWEVLELIAKKEFGYEHEVEEIIEKSDFHWGELIEQAMSHKMFPMVCYAFMDEKLFPLLPPFINQNFTTNYLLNKHKTELIKKQAIRIVEALNNNNVEIVCTKGIVLETLLYDNKGYRFLSDVDFMAKQEDKDVIRSVIEDLGFTVGTVDWKSNSVIPMDRVQYLTYINTVDKLPEYVISLDDSLFKYVSVGFVFSFSWPKCQYHIDVAEALKKGICQVPTGLGDGSCFPALQHSYHFIYIIMHLYKHAWLEHFIYKRNDVNLVKFADVYHYWNTYSTKLKQELPQLIEKHKIYEPVLWTLYHTDYIFNSNIVSTLDMGNFLNEKTLFASINKIGKILFWKGNMRKLLWEKNRANLFI